MPKLPEDSGFSTAGSIWARISSSGHVIPSPDPDARRESLQRNLPLIPDLPLEGESRIEPIIGESDYSQGLRFDGLDPRPVLEIGHGHEAHAHEGPDGQQDGKQHDLEDDAVLVQGGGPGFFSARPAGGLLEFLSVVSIELLPEVILETEFPRADASSDHQQENQKRDEKDPEADLDGKIYDSKNRMIHWNSEVRGKVFEPSVRRGIAMNGFAGG